MTPRTMIPALLASSALALGAFATAGPAAAADPGWYQATRAISCSTTPGGTHFYDGPSASAEYDKYFPTSGAEIPKAFLDNYVPQGLGTWTNWDGAGHNLRLISGHHNGSRAGLIGIVENGGPTKTATLPDAHVGGVAKLGNWLFVAGADDADGYPTVGRYPLSAVRSALLNGSAINPDHVAVLKVGGTTFESSFLGTDGTSLFVGMFDADHRNRMYRYALSSDGFLALTGGDDGWIQVPDKTQGLAVTADHYIFSTSSGNKPTGRVLVERRGYKLLDDAIAATDLACFAAPSMGEGMAILGSNVYLVFESGSAAWRDKDGTRNIIDHLHYATLASLEALT